MVIGHQMESVVGARVEVGKDSRSIGRLLVVDCINSILKFDVIEPIAAN